jgi:serine/threonine protein kinase
MAPELTRRGCAEPKSDIWSFGVVMLEILEYWGLREGERRAYVKVNERAHQLIHGRKRRPGARSLCTSAGGKMDLRIPYRECVSAFEHANTRICRWNINFGNRG